MAELSAKQRAKLPSKDFGLPEKARSADAKKETGNYPMPDKGHAISAKRLSRKQRKDGNLTMAEFDRINRQGGQGLEEFHLMLTRIHRSPAPQASGRLIYAGMTNISTRTSEETGRRRRLTSDGFDNT